MNIKLNYGQYVKREIVDAVNDGQYHDVILTTNALSIEKDRRDARYIKTIRDIRIVYGLKSGGCLILGGNLGCSFVQPLGGEFFVKKAYIDEKTDFNSIKGVHTELVFSNNPMSISEIQSLMEKIVSDDDFVFNLSQFDEFMDIFTFYKTLSSELNNNTTYNIISTSEPYYYVPVDIKDIEIEENNQIVNLNGIVIGYTLEDYKYDMLSSEQQDKVRRLYNIKIDADEKSIKKIKSFADNLYVSEYKEVDDRNSRDLVSFELVNITKEKEFLILSGEVDNFSKHKYLNLYDMGQKVKLESIDNSLRLINQGASGAAAELLEYIIGSKPMPNNYDAQKNISNKEKYVEGLDPSQKAAFMMATDGSPVSLIKGPPGTGKTYVINAIVQYITKELKQKVVISSQTHVAIDNVLDELMENYDLIIPNRITNRRNKYSGKEIDSTLYKTWAKKFTEHNKRSSNKTLSKQIEKDLADFKGLSRFKFSEMVETSDYSVLGATTTTSAIGGKKGLDLLEGYDWLIIDEISKCPITEVLRYLPYVEKIIMVGDDFQLAPKLEFEKDEVQDLPSYDEDKFEKLKSIYEKSVFANTLNKAKDAGRLITLNVNYRSVKDVLNAYNIFYGYTLGNMREKVRPSKVSFTDKYPQLNEKDIFFVDVKNGKEATFGTSRYNTEELCATADVLKDLIENTNNATSVSVSAIFPYAAQIEKFQKEYLELINIAKKTFKSFEIDTVDAFQGRETDIVLVNTVVTDSSRKNFLNDFRRINVSMSRARDKLFVFGNPITLSKIEMKVGDGDKRRYFKDIIDDIQRFGYKIQYEGGLSYESTSKSKIEIN